MMSPSHHIRLVTQARAGRLFDSPVGLLLAVSNGTALCALLFELEWRAAADLWQPLLQRASSVRIQPAHSAHAAHAVQMTAALRDAVTNVDTVCNTDADAVLDDFGGRLARYFQTPMLRTSAQTPHRRDTSAPASPPAADCAPAGQEDPFAGLPIVLEGTPFQQKLWSSLRQIPPGSTLSYSAFAERYLHPRQLRALAANIGRNPLPIVCPCHRVIGKRGALTGFAGGLAVKRALLQQEGALPQTEEAR